MYTSCAIPWQSGKSLFFFGSRSGWGHNMYFLVLVRESASATVLHIQNKLANLNVSEMSLHHKKPFPYTTGSCGSFFAAWHYTSSTLGRNDIRKGHETERFLTPFSGSDYISELHWISLLYNEYMSGWGSIVQREGFWGLFHKVKTVIGETNY